MGVKTISYDSVSILREARKREKGLLALVRTLVELESPSDDPHSVNRCLDYLVGVVSGIGARTRLHLGRGAANILEARFAPPKRTSRKPILLLGHIDTVWPIGTLAHMPFRIAKGRAWGPGVFDMKAGLAMAVTALDILVTGRLLRQPVILLLVGDEETGSSRSRSITERIARRCESVYVLEPAQGAEGACKTARKGVASYRVHVTGVAAHSGLNFEQGRSAVVELARLIGIMHSWVDLKRGITINVGTIHGGTRSNVVAAEAWAEVDVRISRLDDFAQIERLMRSLCAEHSGCVINVEGGLNRPPMERTPGTVALYRRAATLAESLGFKLQETSVGGGSDGNFTSALGIPTLDGMGAVGEGAHAANESVVLRDLVPRTALLAAMISGTE